VSEQQPEATTPPPPPQWQPPWQPPPPPYAAAPGWQPPLPPQSYGYAQPYGYQQPRNSNGFAIASLICSIVGILIAFFGPVLAIVFGIVGLRQTSRLGESGRGLAIAGIVIGSLVLLVDVLIVIGLATTHSTGVGNGVSV
jgi:hypothetical protein